MPGMRKYMGAPSEKPDLPEMYEREFVDADSELPSARLVEKYGTSNPTELKSRIVQRGLQEMQKKEGRPDMKDGGMARGRGGKSYQHNYATGGQVTDHLSRVVGPPMGQPQSVQASTATVETPAQRSKRLRMGG